MMLLLTKLAAMCAATVAIGVAQAVPAGANAAEEAYLRWSSSHAEAIGNSTSQNGKVGHGWDGRGLKTERAIDFKIRATWFTPEVIRAPLATRSSRAGSATTKFGRSSEKQKLKATL